MKKKIFKPIAVGGASALIAITSLFSYAIGLLRDRIIAINFGTTQATDAYNASFLIPDLIFNIFIAGALTAAFMPVFAEFLVKEKEKAHVLANTVLSAANLLIITLVVISFTFMPQIINFAYPDIAPDMKQDIVFMTRLILPSAIFFTISNTLGNILMSYKHFVAYAISPILYNLGIITGIMLLSDSLGIYSAATGVLVGAALHCAIRILDTTATEYSYKPQLKLTTSEFKKIIKLMIPKSISLVFWPINLYLFSSVGIKLIEGGFAAFNYARNIQSFAVSLFGIAFATAVFPHLTEAIGKKDKKTYTAHIRKTIQRILFFTIPAMAGVMFLAEEIVDLILSGGVFDSQSVAMTSLILFFFALSIPFESTVHILARAFYSLQNTITPMIINIIAMSTIAFTTIFVAAKHGIEWFSIGFTIGMIIQVTLLLIFLHKHLKDFDYKQFLTSLSKVLLSTTIMSASLILTKDLSDIINPKLSHLIRIALGGGVYLMTAAIIKTPELTSVNYLLARVFKGKGKLKH